MIKKICNLIGLSSPEPNSLRFKESHYSDSEYLYAWAYSYFIFHKYFRTGPLGTCFFKRGDVARWPMSIVDYFNFDHNYHTMTGRAPMLGLYPRYRVYDDIFIDTLIGGEYKSEFASAIYNTIQSNLNRWSL